MYYIKFYIKPLLLLVSPEFWLPEKIYFPTNPEKQEANVFKLTFLTKFQKFLQIILYSDFFHKINLYNAFQSHND